ncbi:MAG: PAS domain S-box protein [Myxococcales bacterium]|nr:PAS domain S-box protein [Myxococcales bacterium]
MDSHEAALDVVRRYLADHRGVAQLDLEGHILHVNAAFSSIVGYAPDELVGQHHRALCDPIYAESDEYRRFWAQLRAGSTHTGLFPRRGRGNRLIWLRGTYIPLRDASGERRVLKVVMDATEEELERREARAKLQALDHVQGIVEFTPEGEILAANETFAAMFGYTPTELVGRHHAILCDADFAGSRAYERFWRQLRSGEVQAQEFQRRAKDGSIRILKASYTPVVDESGRAVKIVKFASDVTEDAARRTALHEMSTPVIPIWPGVLLTPLVGIMSERRAQDVLTKCLERIAEGHTTRLIMDVAGIAELDGTAARHLIRVARCAALMGCKTIISGLTPSVARRVVEEGVDLETIETAGTLASALERAIEGTRAT